MRSKKEIPASTENNHENTSPRRKSSITHKST